MVAAGIAILVSGGVIGWAGATVLIPPDDLLDSAAYTYVEVVDGEVGSSFNVGTIAEWAPVPIGANQASGVVTSVDVSLGQEVGPGAVLYSVNLRPVVIAQGVVPAFRAMSVGTTGADVAQLQQLLSGLGFSPGSADGRFGSATARAVRGWQKALGIAPDGVVGLGDLIFVPSLPTRVSLDTDLVARGNSVSGGEEVLRGLSAEPTFTVAMSAAQAREMPLGTRVGITGPTDQNWQATIVTQEPSEDQATVTATLGGLEGKSICGADCGEIPVTDATVLRSEVITVEAQSGLVVPVAALLTSSEGALTVVDDHGEPHVVRVVASARGMAIITGVDRGLMVRIPADGI